MCVDKDINIDKNVNIDKNINVETPAPGSESRPARSCSGQKGQWKMTRPFPFPENVNCEQFRLIKTKLENLFSHLLCRDGECSAHLEIKVSSATNTFRLLEFLNNICFPRCFAGWLNWCRGEEVLANGRIFLGERDKIFGIRVEERVLFLSTLFRSSFPSSIEPVLRIFFKHHEEGSCKRPPSSLRLSPSWVPSHCRWRHLSAMSSLSISIEREKDSLGRFANRLPV